MTTAIPFLERPVKTLHTVSSQHSDAERSTSTLPLENPRKELAYAPLVLELTCGHRIWRCQNSQMKLRGVLPDLVVHGVITGPDGRNRVNTCKESTSAPCCGRHHGASSGSGIHNIKSLSAVQIRLDLWLYPITSTRPWA